MGLKPSASQGEARLRGLYWIIYDFTAKTHRRDAECAENFNNEMYALRWSDSLSIFLCERCAVVVTRPFCGRLNAWKNQSGVKDAEVEGIPR